jgi:hypothetical protein
VGSDQATDPGCQARGQAAHGGYARGGQHGVLPGADGGAVGLPAARPVAQEHGLGLLRRLAEGRYLAEDPRRLARPDPQGGWPRGDTQRRLHRHPERQDHRNGWRQRVRRQQEDRWPQASYRGGHLGVTAGRGGHGRQPGRRHPCTEGAGQTHAGEVPASEGDVRRQQVQQPHPGRLDAAQPGQLPPDD